MTILGRVFFMGLAIALVGTAVGAQQAGHQVRANQVVINGRNHWQNWESASGTLTISPDGEVRTRRIEKNTNAVFDIVDYLRFNPPASLGGKEPEEIVLADAVKSGSNVAGIVNLLDGDITTYWQPGPHSADRDLASQWWFVIDLGRVVFAKELVVRFVEEGMGDPFLLFEVLISDGLKPARLQTSENPAFKTVLRTLSKNKSQRVFTVDLTNQEPTVQAAAMRFVQILVTDTDGLLGTEVSADEYEALSGETRGAIQHFKRQPDGREVPVDQDLYDILDEERRGSIRYFRRELPRLAELEVWNEGDELTAGILARGGVISTNAKQPLALTKFVDGDLATFNRIFYGVSTAVADPELELVFDLGSFYWIDAFRMIYNNSLFPNYRMDFSDGSLAPDGSIQWTTRAELNPRPIVRVEGADFEPIKARYGRFQWTLNAIGARTADISELQLYGEGFQPEVSLRSDLIRLGGSRNLLSIEWDADTPPGTQVLIQTRTGNELGEILHYFKKDGTEVTEAAYNKLLSLFRGDTVAEQVPGSDWSNWSAPYENPAGSPIVSPSPREFLTVQATLLSEDPEISPTLRSVRLNFANPVAQRLLGEIGPFEVEELGLQRPFSLYVRPEFGRRDPGFDELLLLAPSNMELDMGGLYGGRVADFDGEAGPSALTGVEVIPTGRDSLHVRFDAIQPNGSTEVLRLDFETALFVTGAVLQASLRNSGADGGGAWQRIDPGEALTQVIGNTTTIIAAVEHNALLTDVVVLPTAFSPNGDGINDRTVFAFNVVRVGDDSPVAAEIYDLGGRPIRRLAQERPFSTGTYEIEWDGRDDGGRMVPPGLYFVQLSVDTDIEGAQVKDAHVLRTVSVAY